MRKLPPLGQLRAFEAVARHLSVKNAAAELAVTPTAVSHQIRALEDYCGQSLFRRRPRPLKLTDAGERLFPVLEEGLDAFEATIAALTGDQDDQSLVISTTNAFASRWLVPRMADWHQRYPGIALDVIGKDEVLDLTSGEADLAIRYMYEVPADLIAVELLRDEIVPVCSPVLLDRGEPITDLRDLRRQTFIHSYWSPADPHAPTWARWFEVAAAAASDLPKLAGLDQLSFHAELHGIEAAIDGQGIILVSDLLVKREMDRGQLVRAMDISLPGYGFYLVHEHNHPRQSLIDVFSAWALSVR